MRKVLLENCGAKRGWLPAHQGRYRGAIARAAQKKALEHEIAFGPACLLLPDFTGCSGGRGRTGRDRPE